MHNYFIWTIFLFKQKHHNLLNTFQKNSQPIEQRQIQAATSASSNMAVNSVSCSHRANLGVIDWDNMLKSKGWDFHVEKLENNVQRCHSLFSIFTNIQLVVLGIPKVDLGSFQAILRGFLSSWCSEGAARRHFSGDADLVTPGNLWQI